MDKQSASLGISMYIQTMKKVSRNIFRLYCTRCSSLFFSDKVFKYLFISFPFVVTGLLLCVNYKKISSKQSLTTQFLNVKERSLQM